MRSGIIFGFLTASACVLARTDLADEKLLNDFDTRMDAEIEFYKADPVKSKERFSKLLSRLSSPNSLRKIQNASSRRLNSKSSIKDAIARRVLKRFKTRSSDSFDLNGSILGRKLNSTMTKVSLLITK